MSSASATAAVTTAANRRTYWCHECDMSVTLASPSSSSSSLLCPHCLTDFLEHMDISLPTSDPSSFFIVDPLPATADDNYLLSSPQFLRLFNQLADSSSDSDFAPFTPIKPSVVAIPTIHVSSTMLDQDPVLLCAICKDQFLLDVEAKQLPCSHLYHPDCILPWLSNHDSCPLCRFKLPSDDPSDHGVCSAATMALSRARDLMHQEDGSYGFGTTLQNIARRRSSVFSEGIYVDSSSQSPARWGVSEIGSGELTHSGETVSSGIVIVNGSGDENGLVGIDGSVYEDAETLV